MRIHIAYATKEGQSAKVADYIADVVRAHGHQADTAAIGLAKDSVPAGCGGVIVGSSIHMGKHDKHAAEYVRHNRETLEKVPSAFFSVSLAAHGDEAEAERYVEEFETETGWHPAHVALFGGALPYTRYGFLKRHLMKRIVGHKPGNLGTDTSRDYVYTEWDRVRRFTEAFLEQLPSQDTPSGGPTPSAGGARRSTPRGGFLGPSLSAVWLRVAG
jgi:menaquinone-dependent protoporphyrinogen oxidase